jgi:uncharacterized protein
MPYWDGVIGGLLIGAASLLLYATLGRIAGISGIAYESVWARGAERRWTLLFIAGLILGGWVSVFLLGLSATPSWNVPTALMLAVPAGLLVGYGTRRGNGCTSGHGICGLSRLSPRSLAAVAVFMGVGIVVATLLRPVILRALS